jgi:glycosyltransferase involved in cell wall biosynthesis
MPPPMTNALVPPPRRIAIVHDWLDTWRGGENVLAEVLAQYPDASLFSLVDFLPDDARARIGGRRACVSFLQGMPAARRRFRGYLPLFPRAIESLDLSGHDLVISISHAVAKGVRKPPGALHVCYCLTPMRYAWDLREAYLAAVGGRVKRALVNRVLDRLRDWDRASASGVDRFAGISRYIVERIGACYDRDAAVVYPPVDVDYFSPGPAPEAIGSYYLTSSRWVPYKRIDAIVGAFRALPERRLIATGDGPEAARIHAAAGPNVEFAGEVPRERLRALMRGARAFVFAAEEDFGIVPLEAQACGTPVIAYARGAAIETLRGPDSPQPTGVFFATQTPSAIAAAIGEFEALPVPIAAAACRTNAERFATKRFRSEFAAFVADAWREHAVGRR